ncbi:NAD(+)--rifampin ADP-ribosyltransferase [Carnobacterium inhibens]|uniref:rRNA adenine methyltransferase n=1 Tax=Carnobacterium inhibens subsp. gilichinskyi TaxID=1266845 RepID=U5S6J1_9LACT|nr:NAD(+)--rifampin ADP-ribosyltransferase [Carnobacterium inhibens]AGY80809.1 rRNA adenine methyltransferase [Carnobacterium inhibens subsp. gilichinskyi]
MRMKFDPSNPIIQLCMKGMALEESGNLDDAIEAFIEAWNQTSDDYERFIAAYHLGLRQNNVDDKLKWMKKSLACALKINDDDVKSAYPTLYLTIANCYEAMNDTTNARKNSELSHSYQGRPTDAGLFYHGSKADLQVGDLLTAGKKSNYEKDLKMNHIYFTANINGAGLAAALSKGEGIERVYIIEPTGEFENDPNVTDKKFPGNLTRSYRSQNPLKVLGEVTDWEKLTHSERQEWDERLAKNKGEIIN